MIGWRQASGPEIVCIGGISMKCGRLLPLLLSLLLSVSLLAPAALARETEFFPDFPEPVPASAQDWSPADPSGFDAARQALLTAVRGEDASERSVLSLLSRMTDRFNELLTEYYFCSLDYMRSPTSCTQEYVRYSSVCGQAESDYLSAVQEVLNSAYGSVLAGLLGEGQAQSLLSTSPIRGRSWPCWSVRLLWSTNTGRRWSRSPLSSPAAGPGPVPRRTPPIWWAHWRRMPI